jgi:hypothetical protein
LSKVKRLLFQVAKLFLDATDPAQVIPESINALFESEVQQFFDYRQQADQSFGIQNILFPTVKHNKEHSIAKLNL